MNLKVKYVISIFIIKLNDMSFYNIMFSVKLKCHKYSLHNFLKWVCIEDPTYQLYFYTLDLTYRFQNVHKLSRTQFT